MITSLRYDIIEPFWEQCSPTDVILSSMTKFLVLLLALVFSDQRPPTKVLRAPATLAAGVLFLMMAFGCSSPEYDSRDTAYVSDGPSISNGHEPEPIAVLRQGDTIRLDPSFAQATADAILGGIAELNYAFPAAELQVSDVGTWNIVNAPLEGNILGWSSDYGNKVTIDEEQLLAEWPDPLWARRTAMHELVHALGLRDHFDVDGCLMAPSGQYNACADELTVKALISVRPDLASGAKATCGTEES